MEKQKTAYLKCTYELSTLDSQYFVNISCRRQGWCFVNKEDVIPLDKKRGYVKCLVVDKEQEMTEIETTVIINDAADKRLSSFRVKTQDIVDKLNAA